MKRWLRVLIIFAGVVASTAVVGVGVSSSFAANTNNFSISSYDIAYTVGRDSENHSTLKTVETITAEFPSYDQNHGLERAIPTTYEGHPTSLEITSVTDGNGAAREYSTDTRSGVKVLRIGDPDEYVHGTQVYTITYTQRDVTKFFENTGRDEWYWDTNGTEWQVPIEELTITATIDSALIEHQAGTPSCYVGVASATDQCELSSTGGGVYTTSAQDLGAGENVTVAFGFEPGTFARYTMSPWEVLVAVWMVIQFIAIPLSLALIIIFGVVYFYKSNRSKELQPIPVEYIPPKGASVMVAAQISGHVSYAFSAQLIDLAVRRFISIIETKEKSTWRAAEYDLVITSDLNPLLAEEKEILSDMFDGLPKVGDRLALSSLKNNMSYSARTLDNDPKLKALTNNEYQLREKVPEVSRFFKRWAIVVTILTVLTLSFALVIATIFLWIYAVSIRPLTDTGLRLRRYVLGLDKYIKAAEAERLKFLQGPDTAEKIGYQLDTSNPGELVKLYERTLPYAVLFGREQDWAKRLGDYYQQAGTSPDWYSGTHAFNAALFATSLSSFSQASVYSAGVSSSSGGSSGGGSSGGGGGGGGGGGW